MNKNLKKNLIILSSTLVLILLAVFLLLGRKSGTIDYDSKAFAVKDTSNIYKIFIADNYGEKVLLERQTGGYWKVNEQFDAVQKNVNDLLDVIRNISIREPVALSARNNVNKWLATGATKVEIYYYDYRIKIGETKLWKYQNRKTYYIGNVTQDNLGNYAILEGGKDPFIVAMPGFRGFISPYYSPFVNDWRSHNIIKLKISKIKEINVVDFENPDESVHIIRNSNRNFDILTNKNQALSVYDTAKLFDHLSEYRDLNFEFFADDLSKGEKDTILSMKFKEVIITDTENKSTKITLYYMNNELDTVNYEYDFDFVEHFNKDKFYAVINDNFKEMVICQYFVFDRIIQPLRYYYKESELIAIPK
ncbi:MAG TPA: hypothetical protein PKX15_03275 [Bacteroidales bacterium]|nr:hypothetical protein [Bacteroidales bacterium]